MTQVKEPQRRNILLTVAYDGTDFHGWQRQPHRATVQGVLENTIVGVVGEPAQVWGSGRTDAGVHALNQMANFKTACRIPCANLVRALNDALPQTVRVKEARAMPPGFHARYDARSKTYRYRILQAAVCSPFLARFVWHYPYRLDRRRMAQAAEALVGEHDFTSFATAGAAAGAAASPPDAAGSKGQAPGAMTRRIFSLSLRWQPRTSMLTYEIEGNGFLHHMVRNIVGTLVEVGRGKLEPEEVARILRARDRTLAGATAPPQALCLVRVEY